jgi:hypothetical protein
MEKIAVHYQGLTNQGQPIPGEEGWYSRDRKMEDRT